MKSIKFGDLLTNETLLSFYEKIKLLYFKYFKTDKGLIKKKFKKHLKRKVNLLNPSKYNDKLQWLKLYWYDPLAITCSDKYEVRNFVKQRIGDKYLNKLLGVYDTVDEINIEKLPKSFVLKGTHGSGFNIICKDKEKMNWKKEFKKMRRWMRTNYYWANREWVYKYIKPRIICERYIQEVDSENLKDFKIFCFNGEPRIIELDFDRFTDHKRNLYDLKWNLLNAEIKYSSNPRVNLTKPENLDEMLQISRLLSKDFPHVRVDLYNIDHSIIFGELTFFHGSGMEKFYPPDFEKKMGSYLKLPEKNYT